MEIRINGERREVAAAASRTLLEVLRGELAMTGTKYGCGEAQAGPQMSSSFLSALPMFGHVQRSTTPPVTRYSPEKPDKRDKGLSKEGSSCFAQLQ